MTTPTSPIGISHPSTAAGRPVVARPAERADAARRLGARLLALLLALVALETLFTVPMLGWLATGGRPAPGAALALAVTAVGAGALWVLRERIAAAMREAGRAAARIPAGAWLAAVALLGLALRLFWAAVFPAEFLSDGGDYYRLGGYLSRGEPYASSGGVAEWPPGYPLLLALHFFLFGQSQAVTVGVNLLLFVALLPVTGALARRVAGEGGARLAMLLLAVWPNLVATAAVANKELTAGFFLSLALLLHLMAGERQGRRRGAWPLQLAAGGALGFAVLTQPALVLLPAALAAYDALATLGARRPWRTALLAGGRLAVLGIGMAVVLLPWAVRNWRAFDGEMVLVSTNGGSVFYRANNPWADGGWMKRGERSLAGLGELEASRVGYQWGKEWIRENPGAFLRLSLRKQMLFLGDNASGVYESLKRGLGVSGPLYKSLKVVANVFWWGLWALVVAGLFAGAARRWRERPAPLLLILVILYFFAIDSVFESGSRHHVPLAAPIAALAVAAAAGVGGRNRSAGSDGTFT